MVNVGHVTIKKVTVKFDDSNIPFSIKSECFI